LPAGAKELEPSADLQFIAAKGDVDDGPEVADVAEFEGAGGVLVLGAVLGNDEVAGIPGVEPCLRAGDPVGAGGAGVGVGTHEIAHLLDGGGDVVVDEGGLVVAGAVEHVGVATV
jgi:hypothetical protein